MLRQAQGSAVPVFLGTRDNVLWNEELGGALTIDFHHSTLKMSADFAATTSHRTTTMSARDRRPETSSCNVR